jgi:hypothetical protein
MGGGGGVEAVAVLEMWATQPFGPSHPFRKFSHTLFHYHISGCARYCVVSFAKWLKHTFSMFRLPYNGEVLEHDWTPHGLLL